MKKFSFLLIALFFAIGSYAQCAIDTAAVDTLTAGFYPNAAHLPHIVRDSAYSQSESGKIQSSMSFAYTYQGIPLTITVRVDSVRLDSLTGLPNGIAWAKSSNTLPGGGIGCVLLSGTTSDTAGVYPVNAFGKIWVHISVPPIVNQDTFSTGSLQQLPQYRNFYVVVDSAPSPLSAVATARNSCGGVTAGSIDVVASGGNPTVPYTYLWNTGSNGYHVAPVDTGTYSVTVTSGIDTVVTTVTVLGETVPLVAVTSSDPGAIGNTGYASVAVTGGVPPYSYRWNNGATTDTITGIAPGTYRVTVRDSFGCVVRDSAKIINLAAGIFSPALLNAHISLYPNPANSVINVVIESPTAMNGRMEIMDVTGKVIYCAPANIANTRFSQAIDLKQFSPGIYILQLTSDNQSAHQRFVVTH